MGFYKNLYDDYGILCICVKIFTMIMTFYVYAHSTNNYGIFFTSKDDIKIYPSI